MIPKRTNNKIYAHYHAGMWPLSATRSETKFSNEAQWNFLGCFLKEDSCQSSGRARLTGVGRERRRMGTQEVYSVPENCTSSQSCRFQNPCSSTTYPPLPVPFTSPTLLHFTALIIQHYSPATHVS